jgi:deoxyribodipyrimidine photolyase-related protein
MTTLRFILGDQLSPDISSLRDWQEGDTILLCEVAEEATYVKHHQKKLVFVFSAMRQFAETCRAEGKTVRYIFLDDPENTGDFESELARAMHALSPTRIVITEAGEWRVQEKIKGWQGRLGLPVEIRPDTRFLASHDDFARWAKGKKQLRMEFFYREMRTRYRLLIEPDGSPTGGAWNFDKENRKPPKAGLEIPPRINRAPTQITREVTALVASRFSAHFGAIEPFYFATSHAEAERDAAYFIQHLLPQFGDYQDAMLAGEAFLFHSCLSAYLNIGLLSPLALCKQAEAAYREGHAPLNAVEGFIRQILGWREFIRGIYWYHMPEYATRNALQATRPLPEFYWSGETEMFCLSEAVRHTQKYAYSHHIQRLMVTGNFALLAGILPESVCEWYLLVYADAYEWVELPNTLGMALFGDDGVVGSKPYAASGKYIHRMSNYCAQCRYNPNETLGENACPFNALYWHFLDRHHEKFARNPRMATIYANWNRMDAAKKHAILAQADAFLNTLT